MTPATMNNAPDTNIGALVARFAYSAIIGAYVASAISTFYGRRPQRITHHDTENTVGTCDDRVTSTPPACREELRRDGVENTVHNVRREGESAVPAEERIGRPGCCTGKEEDTSDGWERGTVSPTIE